MPAADIYRSYQGLDFGGYTICHMVDHPTIILCAVMIEAKAVAKALGIACPAIGRPTCATHPNGPIELHLIGIGARVLTAELSHANRVILAGLAGGLDPAVRIGEVIIDADAIPPGTSARLGKITCSDRIVSTVAEKAELFRRTCALAVDMESNAVRAAVGGRAFLHVRVVSDTAGDILDPAIASLVDSVGNPSAVALARTLLKRPALAADLIHLGRNASRATRALAEAMRQIMNGP